MNKVADACASGAVVGCLAAWATQLMPIVEFTSYFLAGIAALVSIILRFKNRNKKVDG